MSIDAYITYKDQTDEYQAVASIYGWNEVWEPVAREQNLELVELMGAGFGTDNYNDVQQLVEELHILIKITAEKDLSDAYIMKHYNRMLKTVALFEKALREWDKVAMISTG